MSATVAWLNVDFMKAATPPWTPILRSLRRSEYPLIVSSLSSIWLDSQVSVSTMTSIMEMSQTFVPALLTDLSTEKADTMDAGY